MRQVYPYFKWTLINGFHFWNFFYSISLSRTSDYLQGKDKIPSPGNWDPAETDLICPCFPAPQTLTVFGLLFSFNTGLLLFVSLFLSLADKQEQDKALRKRPGRKSYLVVISWELWKLALFILVRKSRVLWIFCLTDAGHFSSRDPRIAQIQGSKTIPKKKQTKTIPIGVHKLNFRIGLAGKCYAWKELNKISNLYF